MSTIINEYELRELVETSKGTSIEVAMILGSAKASMKKKEYKELADSVGLTKDALSLSLKRFRLLEVGFTKIFVQDCTDREIKKLTHKNVENIEALRLARTELSKNEIDYYDFCIEFDKYKVVKSNDEKLITKAKGIEKFLTENTCGQQAMTQAADILQYLVDANRSELNGVNLFEGEEE